MRTPQGGPFPQTLGSAIVAGFEQRLRELESLLDELDRELWRHGLASPRVVDGDAPSSHAGGESRATQMLPTVRRVVGTLLSAAAGRALTLTAVAERLSAAERRQLAAILRLPAHERRAIAELLRLSRDEREQLAATLALTNSECAALVSLCCGEGKGEPIGQPSRERDRADTETWEAADDARATERARRPPAVTSSIYEDASKLVAGRCAGRCAGATLVR